MLCQTRGHNASTHTATNHYNVQHSKISHQNSFLSPRAMAPSTPLEYTDYCQCFYLKPPCGVVESIQKRKTHSNLTMGFVKAVTPKQNRPLVPSLLDS